jgi:hypothetical protein
LPRRNIFFTSHGVLWECCRASADELDPCCCSAPLLFDYRSNVLASLPISERTWYNVLQTYCPTQLSFRRDRLIAIAGLARQLNTITRDEYVAGAWWKSIVDSLCWYRSDTKPLSERDSSYVAPSWSCLSLKDMIQFTLMAWTHQSGPWSTSRSKRRRLHSLHRIFLERSRMRRCGWPANGY